MGQSFNLNGILQAFKVIRSPSLMIPHLAVSDIRQINFKHLHASGIRAVGFDKDNCLTKPYSNTLYPPFTPAWESCRQVFKTENIVIVSNSSGTIQDDPDGKSAFAVQESLKVHVLRHQEKKPGGGQELLDYFKDIPADQIAFVGDRALTDVVFGNNVGMLTVLTTKVVTEEGDNPAAIKIRRAEHVVLGWLDRMGFKPKEHRLVNKDHLEKFVLKEEEEKEK